MSKSDSKSEKMKVHILSIEEKVDEVIKKVDELLVLSRAPSRGTETDYEEEEEEEIESEDEDGPDHCKDHCKVHCKGDAGNDTAKINKVEYYEDSDESDSESEQSESESELDDDDIESWGFTSDETNQIGRDELNRRKCRPTCWRKCRATCRAKAKS